MNVRLLSRPIAMTIVVAAVLLMLVQCKTSGDLPATPASRRFSELILVINSGSYDSIHEYAETNFSEEFIGYRLDEIVDSLMRVHAMSEELTFIRVLSSSRHRVIVELYNRLAEMNTVFGVSVESERPNRITTWYQGPAYLYEQAVESPELSEAQIVDAMDTMLSRLSSSGVFSGVVLIGKGDSILLLRAVGLAHRDPDVSNEIDTRFNIASVGKLFTTIAIAQLAEQGLLHYEDPVGSYLGSDWLPSDVASEITIEHLLTHRSGLGDFLERELMLQASAPPSKLDDYKPIIREDRPRFTPGSQFEYSNSGFILLGAIIEQVTNETYNDYVQNHVLVPAGILHPIDPPRDTTYLPAAESATGYTSRFSSSGRSWTDNTDRLRLVAPSPAGGQYTTVEDLWRFAGAIRTATLIDELTWQFLSAPLPDGGPIGYGFEVIDHEEERVVGHGGSHEGIGAALDIYLNADYTLVVLSNTDRSAFVVREKFADLVLR